MDDEDEVVFVLNGLADYKCDNLTIEFCEGHPILDVMMTDYFEETHGLRFNAAVCKKNLFVFSRR